MPTKSAPKILTTLPLAVFLLGCAAVSGGAAAGTETLLPTIANSVFPNYQTVPALACLKADFSVLRSATNQGNLLMWSPAADILAYIAPDARTGWAVGNVTLVPMDRMDSPVTLAANAAGNLKYSPRGTYIVFAALRAGEGLFTLEAVPSAGGTVLDLFPGSEAKTDPWSSPKVVSGWGGDETHIVATVSCGLTCAQEVDIDLADGTHTATRDPVTEKFDFWPVETNLPQSAPTDLKTALHPNWSPDGDTLVYFDAYGNVWVLSASRKEQYFLDVGTWRLPLETKWSRDGRYLAIRADDHLFLYDTFCAQWPSLPSADLPASAP